MKIATHKSVQATAAAGVIVGVGLVATDGHPAAWAIAAIWAILATIGVAQAARD